jgi:hypothetical protein
MIGDPAQPLFGLGSFALIGIGVDQHAIEEMPAES